MYDDREEITYPLRITRYVKKAGKHLWGLKVSIIPVELWSSGVIGRIISSLCRNHITIEHLVIPEVKAEENAILLFFLSGEKSDLESSVLEIEKMREVHHTRIVSPIEPSLFVDKSFFPILFHDDRALILPRYIYVSMIKGIHKRFGVGGDLFLFFCGKEIGKRLYDLSLSILENEKEILKAFKGLFQIYGFGRVVSIVLGEHSGIIRIKDSFECELFIGEKSQPMSHFVRGIIAGFMQKFTGVLVLVQETRCTVLRDDFCEFTLEW